MAAHSVFNTEALRHDWLPSSVRWADHIAAAVAALAAGGELAHLDETRDGGRGTTSELEGCLSRCLEAVAYQS